MAVYLIAGRLGSGKSLSAVGRIREALRAGRRVATNLNLDLEAMKLPGAANCVRLPDKPTGDELKALGLGNETLDENTNGLLVLDELSSWLNARSWGDKSRQAVLDFFIHSRKYGWDVYLIAQSLGQLDKQLRDALVEYHVICRRMDRLKIPLIGGLVKALSFGRHTGRMPRVHIGFVRYGTDRDSILVERWTFRGNDLFECYDTRQRFQDREHIDPRGDPHKEVAAMFSYWCASWPAKVRQKVPKPRPIATEHFLGVVDPEARLRLAAAFWRAQDNAHSMQVRGS